MLYKGGYYFKPLSYYRRCSKIAINALFAIVINMLSSKCKENIMRAISDEPYCCSVTAGRLCRVHISEAKAYVRWLDKK